MSWPYCKVCKMARLQPMRICKSFLIGYLPSNICYRPFSPMTSFICKSPFFIQIIDWKKINHFENDVIYYMQNYAILPRQYVICMENGCLHIKSHQWRKGLFCILSNMAAAFSESLWLKTDLSKLCHFNSNRFCSSN